MDNQPIIVERLFHALIAKVWSAITNKDEMKIWYFDLAEFNAEKGFNFSFVGGPPEKQYTHLCEVMDVVPGKKLIYSWRYDGYEGNSFVIFDLSEQGSDTLLKLTHEGLETFPVDNPHFAKANFVGGWDHIINTSLKNYLEPGE